MFGSTTFIFQSVEEGMGICQRIVYISYPDSWENKPLPSRIVRGKTAFALHLARTAASAGYHIAVYIFTYTIFFLMNN